MLLDQPRPLLRWQVRRDALVQQPQLFRFDTPLYRTQLSCVEVCVQDERLEKCGCRVFYRQLAPNTEIVVFLIFKSTFLSCIWILKDCRYREAVLSHSASARKALSRECETSAWAPIRVVVECASSTPIGSALQLEPGSAQTDGGPHGFIGQWPGLGQRAVTPPIPPGHRPYGIRRARMNSKASLACRAAEKMAMRSLRSRCSQSSRYAACACGHPCRSPM